MFRPDNPVSPLTCWCPCTRRPCWSPGVWWASRPRWERTPWWGSPDTGRECSASCKDRNLHFWEKLFDVWAVSPDVCVWETFPLTQLTLSLLLGNYSGSPAVLKFYNKTLQPQLAWPLGTQAPDWSTLIGPDHSTYSALIGWTLLW